MTSSAAAQLTSSPSRETFYHEIPASDARDRIAACAQKAQAALLALQNPDGHWRGELQGDSILESEYILLEWILGNEKDPDLVRITNYLRKIQMENGGWNLFPGGAGRHFWHGEGIFCPQADGG